MCPEKLTTATQYMCLDFSPHVIQANRIKEIGAGKFLLRELQ